MIKCCPSCGTNAEHLETVAPEKWIWHNGHLRCEPAVLLCPECHWEGWHEDCGEREETTAPDWHEDCREPY